MIATILQSTPTFHAVLYNEKKVADGVAALLEIKNFGNIDALGYSSPKELQQYLIDYSERNPRIKNPQFHLAISCKGDEWSEEELLDFAHQYLKEMGYGDSDQPLLIYAHRDTDNNHLHIVTSRVAPDGKKINDSNERIKSQKVLEKLLSLNIQKKTEKDLEIARNYNFTDVRQFKSVVEAMGYQCFEKKNEDGSGELCLKKGGIVQSKISLELIKELAKKNELMKNQDAAERMKLKAIFKKYRDLNADRKGLEKDLREQFGITLVWMGSKDDPFGYQVVDFKNKKVYEGYKILNIKDLLNFMSKDEHIKEIETLVDSCLEQNPYISTQDLNKKLKRIGGYLKKDYIVFGKDKIPLEKDIAETLKRNNKIAYRQAFHPASMDEIRIICKFTNFDYPDLIKLNQTKGAYKRNETIKLFNLLVNTDPAQKRRAFHDEGYKIFSDERGVFIINLNDSTILDMNKADIPLGLYSDLIPVSSNKQIDDRQQYPNDLKQKTSYRKVTNPLKGYYGSGSQNREWEVGKHGPDRDDPDQQQGYKY